MPRKNASKKVVMRDRRLVVDAASPAPVNVYSIKKVITNIAPALSPSIPHDRSSCSAGGDKKTPAMKRGLNRRIWHPRYVAQVRAKIASASACPHKRE